jgi:hypothetical protein
MTVSMTFFNGFVAKKWRPGSIITKKKTTIAFVTFFDGFALKKWQLASFFGGFARKKVMATMLSPSFMVAVFFFFWVGPYGLVH